MKKKFLAMLLCLSLIFNMLPLSAFADEAVGQAAPVTAKVDFTAQAAGAFLLAPQFDVEVSSDKAEAYGYTDSVSGAVSALDVLVKAHELMLGEAFTAETAKSCLAFNDTDMVSTIFGMETTANGFTLNNNYPKIGNVGSTVQTQSVVTGDKLDFFVYQDTTAWSDQLAWFMQNGEWAKTINGAPKDQVQLKLMGLSYMNAGSYTLDIHLLGTAVSGAQLAWVSNTGALTAIDGAVTATDGTVALTLPETEGTYQLTAYLPSGSNNPLILSLTEVVVGKAPTVADPCALTALSVADFDNWPANSLALTPEFSSDVLAYEASPANYQDLPYAQNAYLKATAASADVTITAEMNGVTQTVTSGSSSWTTLTKGFQPGVYNTLTVTVTDGKDTKVYTVGMPMKDASGNVPAKPADNPETATPAEPVDVLVTVVNGGFAKAADGTPMYQKSVTVTDADKDGVLSLNEALLAAHKTYNTEDGFATKNTDFGLQITKLWGEATEIVGICKNDTFTNAVNVEVVARDDKIVAYIYQDKTTWTDKYTYFTEAEKTAWTGEAVDLTLNILGYASNLPAANVPLGTYSMADGSFTELNVTTDANGKAAVSFAAPGTYYVGPKAEVGGVNYVPAICKVTVKSAIDTTITSQWPNFRGSDNNMAIVSAKTPKSAETAALKWAVKVGGTGMSDYVGAPIIVGDSLIVAYTDTIAKVSMATGEVTATAAMSSSTGLASAVPATYADGLVFRSLNEGVVEAFNAADLSKVWTYRTAAENASRWQGQSPIVYANGKLYVGFGGNSSGDDEFVCLDAKTGKALWTYSHGLYYWAGAVAIGDYIAVGNDSGNLLVFKQTYAEDEEVAPVSSLATGLGKIRCSLAYSNGRVYFTTQGKYLASAAIDSTTGAISDLQSAAIPYASTSTPVVYGDYVYFGYAGHWKNGGYSFAIAKKADLSIVKSVEMPKEVKASALLSTAYEAEGDLYFYISVNDPIGAIKLVKVTPAKLTTDVDNATEVTDLYVPEDDKQQYCISSMICDSDGTIYYRNDASYLFAIKNSSNTGGSGSGSGSGSGGGSGSDPVGNIRVTFSLLGDTKHGDNGKVHTLAGKNLTTWIAATGVTVKADATVYDVMEKVFNSKNYTMTIGEDGYVSAITTPGGVTLAEFDNGADSGWKYTLNGKYPDVGVTEQTLSNGDKIVFHYTDDYTKEDDENISGGGGGSSATDTKFTAADVEDLIDKIGTVTKDSKKAIEKAREAYDSLTAAQKKNVTNYDKLTAAEKAYTELTGEKIDTTKLPFTDVAKGSWYYDAIKAMYNKGLMNGESATKFMPNNKLSRAMLVTILYRMQNEPNVTANALFNDVANGQWYTKAVAWANDKSIVNGVGDGKFAPNDSVTRQEMAAMLYRYAKAVGMDTTQGGMAAREFADWEQTADWARSAMQWAVTTGLIKGNDDNTINPMGTATRAEVATVIVRLLEK